jgi:hypothetical protein
MFENVQFSLHLHLKCAKSAIMTTKYFFVKNTVSLWVSKNAEFYAGFKYVDAYLNKSPFKKI